MDERRDARPLNRRAFIKSVTAAAGVLVLGAPGRAAAPPRAERKPLKLGFDNFSIRAWGWKAPRLLEYAASLGVDSVLFSDLDVYERHDEKYLAEIRARAADLGLELHAGTGGICPTSSRFNDRHGSAEEHLRLAIRIARSVGSPVVRCFLGGASDRAGEGGIDRHIESTVRVLKTVRDEAREAGVKIAVENHAGDLQARELVELIEAAGKDHVGATIDSGNATWTLEDPLRNLELLGPHAVSSGIRDSMVWEDDEGAVVRWTALGEGCVDLRAYMERFAALCPETPVQLEIISGGPRKFPYLRSDFWPPYARVRGADLAAFVALAKRGRPIPAADGNDRETQKAELEKSIRYAREVLGLGRKR